MFSVNIELKWSFNQQKLPIYAMPSDGWHHQPYSCAKLHHWSFPLPVCQRIQHVVPLSTTVSWRFSQCCLHLVFSQPDQSTAIFLLWCWWSLGFANFAPAVTEYWLSLLLSLEWPWKLNRLVKFLSYCNLQSNSNSELQMNSYSSFFIMWVTSSLFMLISLETSWLLFFSPWYIHHSSIKPRGFQIISYQLSDCSWFITSQQNWFNITN